MQKSNYRAVLSVDRLRVLHERNDFQGWGRCLGHVGLLFVLGIGFLFLSKNGHWALAVAALAFYGVVFSFLGWAGASHELQHNTVFKSKKVNQAWLGLFSFFSWANPVYFTNVHATHHSHTLDSHLDEEVKTNICLRLWGILCSCALDLPRFFRTIKNHWYNSRSVIPGRKEHPIFGPNNPYLCRTLAFRARVLLIGQGALLIVFLVSGFWQGVFLFTLAPFIATGFANLLATAQHCGMDHDSKDYRKSTRTIILNPFLAFLYWNMNYHVEHHMYPGIPCYNLPKLNKIIQHDLGAPTFGLAGVWRVLRENNTRKTGLGECSSQAL
jgi:fatty acid desaturase